MTRISPILINAGTAALVVICTALLALSIGWWVGLNDQAYLHLKGATLRFEVESDERRIIIAAFPSHPQDRSLRLITIYPEGRDDTPEHSANYGDILGWSASKFEFLGFAYGRGPNGAGASWVIALPLWLPFAAAATLLLILWYRRRRQALRRSSNLCAICAYDLRATPDRCPECGKIPARR